MNRIGVLKWLKSKRVAVLKGGWSLERSISLKTGQAVERAFHHMGVRFFSMDVQPDVIDVLKKKRIQFCFNCLHGPFGEDGRIQSLLDRRGIGYTGSGAMASSLAMDKNSTKELLRAHGVPTPDWVFIRKGEELAPARRLLSKGFVFVKPFDQGSAFGISKVKSRSQLGAAVKKCFKSSEGALVERFIPGRELTVGILGPKALPVIEIIPQHAFYDFHSKYAEGGSRHVVPAPISAKATRTVKRLAQKAFHSLGCSVFGRVDFIMTKNGRMETLEVNTIPGMTHTSLLPDAARALGIDFDELVLQIVAHSIKR